MSSATTRWLSRLYYHKDALHPEKRLEQARLKALNAAKATIQENQIEKSPNSTTTTTTSNQHKKGKKKNHQLYMTKPIRVKLPPNDGTSIDISLIKLFLILEIITILLISIRSIYLIFEI